MSHPVKKALIVTKEIAPYRMDLYDALGKLVDVEVFCGRKGSFYHNWTDGYWDRYQSLTLKSFGQGSPLLRRILSLFKADPATSIPSFKFLKAFWKAAKREPNVTKTVLIHEFSPFCIAAHLLGKCRGLPVYYSSDMGPSSARGGENGIGFFMISLHKVMSRFVDGKVANTLVAKEDFRPDSELPILFAPHAARMPVREMKPSDGDSPELPVRIGFVGALCHRKGIDLLFDAIARNQNKLAGNVVFVLAGGGDDSAQYHQMAEELSINHLVEFIGFVEAAALDAFYASLDAFILPTRYDTFAVVVQEAASHSLPLLISEHAGAASVFVEQVKNGVIFNPLDEAHFDSCFDKLLSVLDKLDEMGRRSFELADEYSVTNSAAKLSSFLFESSQPRK